jgi:hypothetical protein
MNNKSNSPDTTLKQAPADFDLNGKARFVYNNLQGDERSPKIKLWVEIPKHRVDRGYYVSRYDDSFVVFVEGYIGKCDSVCIQLMTPDRAVHQNQVMTSGIFEALFKKSEIYH